MENGNPVGDKMEYETIIGLEIHVQLLTQSKMFCSCRADYQAAPPNSLVCPVCLGMPGVLPVINKKAVEYTIMTGLGLACHISSRTKFDRKNYPYPDLMKGYQISQYDAPIATGGYLEIDTDGHTSKVGITRVHLEEDVAKLQHVREPSFAAPGGGNHKPGGRGESYSLVDVNRSGVPLMEIVSEPDMRSAEEARQYLTSVHSILQYLGVSTGNMQDGSFRCDANVSVRPVGSSELMARVEVKNMNSFRAVYHSVEYETGRQVRIVEDGGKVAQETRGWVEDRNLTVSQRSKEYAHDYRYFPEPDLPPLVLDPAWVQDIRARLPELPAQRRSRFMGQYGLPPYDASLLTASRATADYFESCMGLIGAKHAQSLPAEHRQMESWAKRISNWILGDLAGLLNAREIEIQVSRMTPAHMVDLVELIDLGILSTTLAKTVLEECFDTGKAPRDIVKEKGYVQISDSSQLESAVAEAIASSPQAVSDYLRGKETAAKFLVGQVMKITKGKAKPDLVNELVREKLDVIKTS